MCRSPKDHCSRPVVGEGEMGWGAVGLLGAHGRLGDRSDTSNGVSVPCCTSVYVRTFLWQCMCVHVSVYVNTCVHVSVRQYVRVRQYACVHVYCYVKVYVYT